MRRLAQLVNKMLRKIGLELRPVPRSAHGAGQPLPKADRGELKRLDDEIQAFLDGPAHYGHPGWQGMTRAKIRRYLHDARIARYHQLLGICREQGVPLDRGAIADFGTYYGYLIRLIAEANPQAETVGYDVDLRALELARHLAPSARFEQVDIFADHAKLRARFDVVFCMQVLEHLEHPAKALGQLLETLRPGGHLVLTIPDGREDSFVAGAHSPHEFRYTGHINFWSPESFKLFLDEGPGARTVYCGKHGANLIGVLQV